MKLPDVFHFGALPIGIDIGASGVRMLQFRRTRRRLEVIAASRIVIPEAAAGNASDTHIAAVADAIKARLASGGFAGSECAIAIDDRWVRVRSVRHPRMPDDELERAVRLDAPNRLGFPETDTAEVGWIRAGEVRQGDDHREEVILIGSRREPVERLVFALADAGLRPTTVEPGFVAVARALTRKLRRLSDQGVVRMMVDIGLQSTGVTVTRGQGVAFHKPLEIGGAALTKAAAERLGLEEEAIWDLRYRRMTPGAPPIDPKIDRALYEAIRPVIVDIANEVSLCLRYFGVSFRGSRPDACLVVGGDAAEPRLTDIIGEALHIPTSSGAPLEGIQLDTRASSWCAVDAPWAVAAGMGLRAYRGIAARSDDRRALTAPSDRRDEATIASKSAAPRRAA